MTLSQLGPDSSGACTVCMCIGTSTTIQLASILLPFISSSQFRPQLLTAWIITGTVKAVAYSTLSLIAFPATPCQLVNDVFSPLSHLPFGLYQKLEQRWAEYVVAAVS